MKYFIRIIFIPALIIIAIIAFLYGLLISIHSMVLFIDGCCRYIWHFIKTGDLKVDYLKNI
jgi:hypothetical protein